METSHVQPPCRALLLISSRPQDLETQQTSCGSFFPQRLAQEAAGKEFAYQDCWRLLHS